MATGTITSLSVCPGGEHLNVRLAVGAQNFDFSYEIDELRAAITTDDRRAAVLAMIKFHCGGMTKVAARAQLASPGISVVTT